MAAGEVPLSDLSSTGFGWIELAQPPASVTRTRIARPTRFVNWASGAVGLFSGTVAGAATVRFGSSTWPVSSPLEDFLVVGVPVGIAVFFVARWYLIRRRLTPVLTRIRRVSASAGMLWIESPNTRSHWIPLEEMRLSEYPITAEWYSVTFPGRGGRVHVFYVPISVASRLRALLPPTQ
jgi:hypothetical protein